jgi:hypothetical protein
MVTAMPATELEQILMDFNEIITHLLRLSVTMRGPILFDRFIKMNTIDTSFYHEYDKNHVHSKFPTAHNFLCDRVGKANSQRRQFFKYRKMHSEKLAQGLQGKFKDTGTVASSLPSRLKDQAEFIPQAEQESASNAAVSETSYATSFADSTRLRVPSLPENCMDGIPFECRFCYSMIEINSRHAWK